MARWAELIVGVYRHVLFLRETAVLLGAAEGGDMMNHG